MIIKGLNDYDIVNYKLPSMFVACPKCSFKCDIESGHSFCHNSNLVHSPDYNVEEKTIVDLYLKSPLTKAIIFSGLEPFDSPDLFDTIEALREKTDDDIVIYTGFTEEELTDDLKKLEKFKNIVIKFGRFRPDQIPHFDEILGVLLASDNQYARRIS